MSPERESGAEVSLRRLCAVTRLGPGPAVAVGRAVLAGLAELHLNGLVHGAVTADAVLVGDDGTVRLAGEGNRPEVAPGRLGELQARDVAAAWELLGAVLRASPVTPPAELAALTAGRPPGASATAVLEALTGAAGELAAPTGARRAAVRLAEQASPLRRYRHGPPQPTAGALGAATVITAPPVGAGRPAPAGVATRRRPVLAALVGVAAVAALGSGLLASRGSTGPTAPSSAAPAATPLPQPPPPPPIPNPPIPAPANAGVVAAVRLIPASGPCLPAAACTLRIGVELLPGHAATTVRVVLELVDRCTGVRTEVAVAPLEVRPGAATVGTTARVRVPAGPAPSIVAITTAPARAASPPLLVATYLPTC